MMYMHETAIFIYILMEISVIIAYISIPLYAIKCRIFIFTYYAFIYDDGLIIHIQRL